MFYNFDRKRMQKYRERIWKTIFYINFAAITFHTFN